MTGKIAGQIALGSVLTLALATQAHAWEGEDWWIGGRVQQGTSIAYDLGDEQAGEWGPSNFSLELNGDWSPTDTLTFVGSFWLRGDWYPDIGGKIRQGGIQDFTSPGFVDQFQYSLNSPGNRSLPNPFGVSSGEVRFLDNFDADMIRELSVKYRDPEGRFAIKLGKFQRGWGQSDGLRLLDVLHPQDLRERMVLRDSEDTRIPLWMTSIDLDFDKLGLGAPFEALGMNRPTLEVTWAPEGRHSEFVINNPTPTMQTSGGIFGFPFPRLIDSKSGFGLPFIGVNLSEKETKNFSLDDSEIGVRLKFAALGGEWTLNGFYGQQDLPVVSLTGANLVVGNPYNDESAAAAVVPFDAATTVGIVHGPGGYLDFLRGETAVFPLPSPPCADITLPAFPTCSVNLTLDLDYQHRQKLLGFSFTRDMREFKFGPKNVSPVARMEFAYEFDKPFNKSSVVTPFGEVETGTTALVALPDTSIVERDQWSLMAGFDYFLWLPFWKDQRSSIFTSFQFFNVHTQGERDILFQAPYSAKDSRINKNQQYLSFLWSTEFFNDQLVLEGLTLYDISYEGFSHRQRLDFNFFGDRIRPRLEWITFSAEREQGLLGLFDHSDIVEASVAIQF